LPKFNPLKSLEFRNESASGRIVAKLAHFSLPDRIPRAPNAKRAAEAALSQECFYRHR
jgi:hypothetical protein